MAIKTALLDIGEDDQQIGTTKHEAKSLASSMDTLETALMSVLWNVILTRYNDTSLKFVHCTCDLKLAADLLESLHTFTDDYRNRFDEFEAKAKEVSSVSDVRSCFSTQRTRHFDEVEESAETNFALKLFWL